MKKLIIPIAIMIVLGTLTGCDAISDFLGLGVSGTRPAFPEPESYIAAVPEKSDELVIESVVPTNFLPAILKAKNDEDNNIFDFSGTPANAERILLVNNKNLVAEPSHADYPGEEFQSLAEMPQLQLVRYWVLLDGPYYYPGGTTTSKTVGYSYGTSSTETYSFTESLSVSVSASVDAVVASASTTVTAEFEATQEFESTFEQTYTDETEFTVTAEEGKEYRLCYVAAL